MRVLAVVTARAASKRLPGKNTRLLGGRPLLLWTIDSAKEIPDVCDILVSTEDPEIADVARGSGVLVPWLRPAELAADDTSSVDVCLHALDWYENRGEAVDGLLLLQPTSPFRSRRSVRRGIELYETHDRRPVVGVSPAKSHPMLCFELHGNTMRPFVRGGGFALRSQDLPAAFVDNGAFYLASPEHLRKTRSFYGKGMVPLLMEHDYESIDIDTERDWKMAESTLATALCDYE